MNTTSGGYGVQEAVVAVDRALQVRQPVADREALEADGRVAGHAVRQHWDVDAGAALAGDHEVVLRELWTSEKKR